MVGPSVPLEVMGQPDHEALQELLGVSLCVMASEQVCEPCSCSSRAQTWVLGKLEWPFETPRTWWNLVNASVLGHMGLCCVTSGSQEEERGRGKSSTAFVTKAGWERCLLFPSARKFGFLALTV